MKKLHAFDLVILAYAAILSAIVLASRPEGTLTYLAYHAGVLAMIGMIFYAYERYGGPFWTFARYWYVIPVVLASFRELHYLVPQVHPFDDYRYDHILAAIDRRWFGDVDGFFLGWPAPVVDLLHLCYWFYFIAMMIPGAALYARRDWVRLREYTAVALTALYISYLGYLVVPAVGPHHFYPDRPLALDGWVAGRYLHQTLMAIEWNMPDAFPSGHALMSMVVIVMSWRLHRPSFAAVVAPSLGCILATMALRYHYVVDVAASVAILPGSVLLGLALHRRFGKTDLNEAVGFSEK